MILLSNKHSDQVFQISNLDIELQEFILQMDSKLTTHSTISRMTLRNLVEAGPLLYSSFLS